MWTFIGKNWSIINKVRTFELAVSFIVHQRSCFFGARVHPSVTNDHHLWSLHKGYFWRSPQHTQQINLVLVGNSEFGSVIFILWGLQSVNDKNHLALPSVTGWITDSTDDAAHKWQLKIILVSCGPQFPSRQSPPLQLRHNWCYGVSNHQPHDCLLKHLFRHRSIDQRKHQSSVDRWIPRLKGQ